MRLFGLFKNQVPEIFGLIRTDCDCDCDEAECSSGSRQSIS